jgi:hypothetical protein
VLDQLQTNGLPEIRIDLLGRVREDRGKRPDRRNVPEAGELLERHLRVEGQAVQFANHQVDEVVAVPLRVNAIEVPGPLRVLTIEGEPSFFGERLQKLHDEGRIARRLSVHQLREWGGVRRVAAERIRNELLHMFAPEFHQIGEIPPRWCAAHRTLARP